MPTKNNLGGITFGTDARLYTVGFDNSSESNPRGAVLRFDGWTDTAQPSGTNPGAIFTPPDDRLVRPIGILFTWLPKS